MSKHQRHFRTTRRGTAYVLVVGIGMVISAMVYGVVVASQVSSRTMPLRNNAAEAEVLSRAAIDQAVQIISTNALWRTTYLNNIESTRMNMGRGTVSFKLVDESSGLLSASSTNPVRVYGIGRVGKATKVCSIVMSLTEGPPYSSLRVAAASAGSISMVGLLLNPIVIPGAETVFSNTSITITFGTLNSTNLESPGLTTSTSLSGSGAIINGAPARTFPDAYVFDYYKTNGTTVSYSSTGGAISWKLLSPTVTALSGGLNAKGIYVIDCGGSAFNISNSRIVGTLVILNTSGVTISGQVSMEPAIKGYPCLLVQGNLTWSTTSGSLSESGPPATNLNPVGVPYPYNYGSGGGATNATTTDTYPNQINGLVYCSGNLSTTNQPVQNKGVLIAGGTWSNSASNLALAWDPYYTMYPPPGFYTYVWTPNPTTWRWELAQ
jgi:hypothetical protein